MIKLLIVDGLNLLRRLYSALPVEQNDSPDIVRFLNATEQAFKHILQQHQPSHAVCVMEHYQQTWRHQLYPPYKANRKPQPEAMLAEFPEIQEIAARSGIGWLDIEGYEADDIIASIVHTTRSFDCQNLVLSTDHLMAQMLDSSTLLYDHFGQRPIDSQAILKRYGVQAGQLPDYFALVGSSSVNVQGITGIGAKTASSLLQEYANCEALLDAEDLPDKVAKRLQGNDAALYLYRGLFQLRNDCPIHGNLKQWRVSV